MKTRVRLLARADREKCLICGKFWSHHAETMVEHLATHDICAVVNWRLPSSSVIVRVRCVCGREMGPETAMRHYTRDHAAECVMLVNAGYVPPPLSPPSGKDDDPREQ